MELPTVKGAIFSQYTPGRSSFKSLVIAIQNANDHLVKQHLRSLTEQIETGKKQCDFQSIHAILSSCAEHYNDEEFYDNRGELVGNNPLICIKN